MSIAFPLSDTVSSLDRLSSLAPSPGIAIPGSGRATSRKRIAANRRNALRSTGPRTDTGQSELQRIKDSVDRAAEKQKEHLKWDEQQLAAEPSKRLKEQSPKHVRRCEAASRTRKRAVPSAPQKRTQSKPSANPRPASKSKKCAK